MIQGSNPQSLDDEAWALPRCHNGPITILLIRPLSGQRRFNLSGNNSKEFLNSKGGILFQCWKGSTANLRVSLKFCSFKMAAQLRRHFNVNLTKCYRLASTRFFSCCFSFLNIWHFAHSEGWFQRNTFASRAH